MARSDPATVPLVVGGLLVVVAVFLAVDVLRGGRGEPEGGEDIELTGGSDWRTVADAGRRRSSPTR